MKRALIVLGAALVLMVGGAVVYAAIPSNTGVFTACVQKSSGAVRIIDASKSCSNSEQRVTWNQAGQPGAPGTNGTNGVSGYEQVSTERTLPLTGSYFVVLEASCPASKVMTGGGAVATTPTGGGSTGWLVPIDGPLDENTWKAGFSIPDDGREDPVVLRVTAYCTNAN